MKKWIQKIFNTTPTPPKNGWVDAKDEVIALVEIYNCNKTLEKDCFLIIETPNDGIHLYKSSDLIVKNKTYEEMLLTISYFGFKYFDNKWD